MLFFIFFSLNPGCSSLTLFFFSPFRHYFGINRDRRKGLNTSSLMAPSPQSFQMGGSDGGTAEMDLGYGMFSGFMTNSARIPVEVRRDAGLTVMRHFMYCQVREQIILGLTLRLAQSQKAYIIIYYILYVSNHVISWRPI